MHEQVLSVGLYQMQVLTWLKAHNNGIKFDDTCLPARMLMLAHGFSFEPSNFAKGVLRDVERRHLAFHSVVRQQRQRNHGATCLPPELLKVIGCAAGIDFSWRLNGQVCRISGAALPHFHQSYGLAKTVSALASAATISALSPGMSCTFKTTSASVQLLLCVRKSFKAADPFGIFYAPLIQPEQSACIAHLVGVGLAVEQYALA